MRPSPATCSLEEPIDDQHTYDPPSKYLFLSGESLSIRCSEGYWIGTKPSSSVVTTCLNNGTWSVHPICTGTITHGDNWRNSWSVCASLTLSVDFSVFFYIYILEVVCSNERPTGVQRWNIQERQKVRLRDTAQFECSSGYESADQFQRAVCTRDGWSPDPLCLGTEVNPSNTPVAGTSLYYCTTNLFNVLMFEMAGV